MPAHFNKIFRMRKITLFVAVMALSISSCSKNDDKNTQDELLGKWEFAQVGTIVMGQEFLIPYQHQTNCTKDFIAFETTTVSAHTFDGVNCAEDVDVDSYVRSGNVLNIMVDGQVETAEILVLNNTTLKIKTVKNIQGQAQQSTIVYTRV